METKNIDELKGDPRNPRTLSKHDGEALARSMKEFGDLSCIVFNTRTSQLVGGHQRIEILKKVLSGAKQITITTKFDTPDHVGTTALGYVVYDNRQFAYREVDWDSGRQHAANIAANRISGEFNLDMLAELNYELSQLENGADLLLQTGQTQDEIERLLRITGMESSGTADESADPNEIEKVTFELTPEQAGVVEQALGSILANETVTMPGKAMRGSALAFMSKQYIEFNKPIE